MFPSVETIEISEQIRLLGSREELMIRHEVIAGVETEVAVVVVESMDERGIVA
jgi:hypothetical protein